MTQRATVLVPDFLTECSVEREVLGDDVELILARAWDESALADLAPRADAMLVFHDIPHLGEATFALAPRCKGVVRAGVGFNNVDLRAAGRRGIAVCNVPDYGTEEVADHSIMLLLAAARLLLPCDAQLRSGGWDPLVIAGAPRLRGQTIGLIGCGRIGMAMAERVKAFGLDPVFYDPHQPRGWDKALGIRRAESIEDLMRQSRFVSAHCLLDDSTRHLIRAETLALMPPGGVVVNTARGPVVRQADLVDALDSGHLFAAGLDVFEREPLDDERLRNHPRVVLTPHVAFYSVEGWDELRRKAAGEIKRLLDGQRPWNLVNGQHLDSARTVV